MLCYFKTREGVSSTSNHKIKIDPNTIAVAVITAIIALIGALLAAELAKPVTIIFPTVVTEPASLTPTPITCAYQGATDNDTIVNLIGAEADASNRGDIKIMQTIFAPGAIFYDYASSTPKKWVGPLARYKDDLFQTTKLKQVEHINILPVGLGIAGNMAWYTSGSTGFYSVKGGEWQALSNGSLVSTTPPSTPFGSEHWKLQKNNVGCWVIIQMDFNAGHIPFPP